MTWIRWETTSPMHEGVAHLAEALNVSPAQAFGHFVAACCGFGEYQPDGRAASVTDTAIELWALWSGRRGRFASVFRSECLETRTGQRDEVGVVKGWWRQEALLREQERSRKRPGQGSRKVADSPDEAPRGPSGAFAVPSRGNEDEDVNVDGTTTAHRRSADAREGNPPTPEGSELAKLVNRISRTSDRWAVWNLVDRIPDLERPGWIGQLNGYLDGLDLGPGQQATPEQLATACRDYACNAGNPSPMHFRAYVRRIITQPPPRQSDGPNGPRRGNAATGQAALDAAADWARRKQAQEASSA